MPPAKIGVLGFEDKEKILIVGHGKGIGSEVRNLEQRSGLTDLGAVLELEIDFDQSPAPLEVEKTGAVGAPGGREAATARDLVVSWAAIQGAADIDLTWRGLSRLVSNPPAIG